MKGHGSKRRGFFRYGSLALSTFALGFVLLQSRMLAQLLTVSDGAEPDPTVVKALSRQWAESPEDVAILARAHRNRMLPMIPPTAGMVYRHGGGYVIFDPNGFPKKFWVGLTGVLKNGVKVYPVTLVEDPTTRAARFYNAKGREFYTLPPPPDYDPFAWLFQNHPELYVADADPALRMAQEAIWDPARIRVAFDLVPASNLSQLSVALSGESKSFSMSVKTLDGTEGGGLGMWMLDAISELAVVGIRPTEEGVAIQIAWPDGFTNRLDIFARDALAATGWYAVAEGLETAGTNLLEWVDTAATGQVRRFYRVGNADLDTDQDGITDARERLIFGTDPEGVDTDNDGLTDWEELNVYGTNPTLADTDDDLLPDGAEVMGWDAWTVTMGWGSDWREPGASAVWVTNWNGGEHQYDYVNGALSDPFGAMIRLGDQVVESFCVGSDGFLLLGGSGTVPESIGAGVNLPLPWPDLNGFVAPFWDELWVRAISGVWVEVSGSGSTERITVTWLGAGLMSEADQPQGLDFQCEYSATDGSFTYRYREAAGFVFPTEYALFTVGLQGKDNAHVARVLFNRPNILLPGHRIRIEPAITDPLNPDTDDDGLPDGFESSWGWDPLVPADPESDWDGDGLSLMLEITVGTSPWNVDTDGDGFTDLEEWLIGMDPLDPDDIYEDYDEDGLTNWQEWMYGADPWNWDADGDGVGDGEEAAQGSDPADPSDGGEAPAETVEIQLTMDNGGYWLTDRVPGTVFGFGKLRYRQPPDGGNDYNVFRVAKGKAYQMVLYSQEGMIQQRPLSVSMTVDGEFPLPISNHEASVAAGVLIENPRKVLGFRNLSVCAFGPLDPSVYATNSLDPERVPPLPEIERGNWRLIRADSGWEWRPRVTMKARICIVRRAWNAVWRTFPTFYEWKESWLDLASINKFYRVLYELLFGKGSYASVAKPFVLEISGVRVAPLNTVLEFTARILPEHEGYFSWHTYPPVFPVDYDNSNATLRLKGNTWLYCSFYAYTNCHTPVISNRVAVSVLHHDCSIGEFETQVPAWLMANWNDSNLNGVRDALETPIPPGDPDAKMVYIQWRRTNELQCCRYFVPNPRMTIRLEDYGWLAYSNPQVWIWNTNLTEGYTLPTNVPADSGPWVFSLECCQIHPMGGGVVDLKLEVKADPVAGEQRSMEQTIPIRLCGADIYEPVGDVRIPVRATNLFILDGQDGPCRYDWQAVDGAAPGMTALRPVSGVIYPVPRLTLQWTISDGCGSFDFPQEEVPWHISEALPSPPSSRDGVLRIEGWASETALVAVAERGIRIYDDHLRRDMENFTPEYLSPFHCWHGIMAGSTGALRFTAFDAARHAYEGKRASTNEDPFWLSWSNPVSVLVTNAGYEVPEWDTLNRGDLIVYRRGSTNIHVQTCTGNGDETWGADNAPRLWDAQLQMYTNQYGLFVTAPAGIHYQQACPDLFPVEIRLYKKPLPGE